MSVQAVSGYSGAVTIVRCGARWAVASIATLAFAWSIPLVETPWLHFTIHAQSTPAGQACPAGAEAANLNFTLKDINDRKIKLSDYKGKVILLDFWATWCPPCKIEIP